MDEEIRRRSMTVEQIVRWSGVVSIVLILTACASQQVRYFRQNVNQANYDAVAKRLGPPHHSQELTTGETIWSYQYRNGDCEDYVLTFDRAKVLREWKEQKC
jgi:hypothetical protein